MSAYYARPCCAEDFVVVTHEKIKIPSIPLRQVNAVTERKAFFNRSE